MDFELNALNYICRDVSGVTVVNFMEDHAPVGYEILESLKTKRFVVVTGEEIKMTMRGFYFLATRWK